MTARCVIEGAALRRAADVYDALAAQLALPAHLGRNLDALWDALTTDLAGPVEIVWRDVAASRATLGADADRLIALLREVAAARDDVRLIIS
jgi:ribonuclease inhibitor